MVSGTTLVNATASMMALGLDPRFDLTHAYILINGHCWHRPAHRRRSVQQRGRATCDRRRRLARSICAICEAPKDWPYGIFPTSAKQPNPPVLDDPVWHRSNLFTLNQRLVQWAFDQTRSLKLPDDPAVAAFRVEYTNMPNAQRPPFVLLGDTFASDYYWHGTIMNTYAEDWVKLCWTHGKGVFATTRWRDSWASSTPIDRLDEMHRVDRNRVLVLRTGSNYSMERPGHDAVESV